jgi:hypothetical protein
MSILIVALPVAIVVSLLRGGRLSALDTVALRATWLVVVGLGVQVAVVVAAGLGWVPVAWADSWVPIVLGQAIVLAWLLLHRHVAGTGLLALGVVLNAADAVVAATGPASSVLPRTTATLGGVTVVMSLGDAIAAIGLGVLAHALLSHRPPAERRLAAALERAASRRADEAAGTGGEDPGASGA